jgi:hypothetical protein
MDGYKGEDVVNCSDGGYAFNGSCYIEDPWDPGNYLEYYGFTMKTDSDGIIEWVKKDTVSFITMNQGSALVQTADGGFITAVIPWLAGQGALIKRDADGNREWTINPGLWVHSMTNTNDGNIIIAGAGWGGVLLKKISLGGSVIWEETFNISWFNSVVESSDGCLLLTGIQAQNVYVAKTDADGDTLWTRTYDSFGDDEGKCIFETNTGEIIVVGRFDWSTGFIWKLDHYGETIDLEIVDTNIGKAIWSGNELNDTIITWGSSSNFIPRFNRFDIDLNYIDTMPSSCSQGDKAFIVEGEYLIFCKWPNITITKTLFEPVAVDENIMNVSKTVLKAYPNPFNPTINFSFNLEKSGETEIKIFNIKGQKVETLALSKQQSAISWDAENHASGIYYCKLVNIGTGKVLSVKKVSLLK